MKISLSSLIKKRPLTRFISAVPLLTDVYVSAHNWNADDFIYQVYKRKRDYVIYNLLILNIKNKNVVGNVRYKYVYDDHDCPCFEENGEHAQELDLDESDVNLIELIRYMVNERQEIDIIPDELLIAAGIDPPKHSVLTDPSTTTLPQKEFIDAIENADVECDSCSASNMNNESQYEQVPVLREDTSNQKYCFMKVGQGWNIRFGEVDLPGIKHKTGIDYIKILLQNPYDEIGVFDIQTMMNPENMFSSKVKKAKDTLTVFKDEDEVSLHSRYSTDNDTDSKSIDSSDDYSSDADSVDHSEHNSGTEAFMNAVKQLPSDKRNEVAVLYKQIEESKAKLEEAREYNDTIEISRLSGLLHIMKDDMYNIIYSRSDDPELEKNRKKVYKNIKDAREYIQAEEISRGYTDTPFYNYLKKFIETGTTCKYNPLVDDPIYWIF